MKERWEAEDPREADDHPPLTGGPPPVRGGLPSFGGSLSSDNWGQAFSLAMQILWSNWVTGDYPHIARRSISSGVRRTRPLTLPGGKTPLTYSDKSQDEVFQEAEDGSWLLACYRDKERAYITVAARDAELATTLAEKLQARLNKPRKTRTDNSVPVRFWFMGSQGPQLNTRRIGCIPWDDITGNYTARVQDSAGTLMKMTGDDIRGRVILMYGPPGTGKTTMLRSLALSWRDWCDVSYIMDPEIALNNGTYLMEALLTDRSGSVTAARLGTDGKPGRWKLIVMEDCGELFTANAKKEAGQGLSRLLNLADGILGQGQNLIFALTTNEPVTELHPAVMRPGRALMNLEIPPLSHAEAKAWLGRIPAGGDLTLASLFAERGTIGVISSTSERTAEGAYL